jgi:hypothetical protein
LVATNMITRHFYRSDEVRAALLYAIVRGRPQETAFWCQEFIDTELYKEAWATLIEAWLWFSLSTDPNWIMDVHLGTSIKDLHLAAYRLSTNAKDNSLWATLLTTVAEPPDLLCANVPSRLPFSKPCLERYLSLALFQRKGLAAIWAARRLGSVQAQLPAESYLIPTVLEGLVPEAVALSAQILWICARTPARPELTVPADLAEYVQRLTALTGRKARRLFAVPVECLYGITDRGCGKESTIEELRRMDDRILEEREGSWWWTALAPYRSQGAWRSDDAMEEFYAMAFPDDIPDEWGEEEAAKSHGMGMYRPMEGLLLRRLGRIWFQAESRFVWGFYEWPATLECEGIEGGLNFSMAATYLNDHCYDSIVDELLEPVHKLLITE